MIIDLNLNPREDLEAAVERIWADQEYRQLLPDITKNELRQELVQLDRIENLLEKAGFYV